MATDKDKQREQDLALFREAVRGVRPLKKTSDVVSPPRPVASAQQRQRDEQAALEEMAAGHFDFENLEYGDEAFYQRDNITRATMRKLRRGQYAVEAELDLHGFTLDAAREELAEFLDRAIRQGFHCVRVIHGKGHRSPGKTPVLKPMVASWLARWSQVLAFCTARPVDGGTGALYVLLKDR